MNNYLSGTEADQPVDTNELLEKRVLMLLAQGFEDIEAACICDVFGWTGYRPSIATVTVDIAAFHKHVSGAFGTTYAADVLINNVSPASYDALVIPGGFHNRGFDEACDDRVREIARAFHSAGKPIATMCVGILPVAEAGVLEGEKATTYALSSRHDNFHRLRELGCAAIEEPVVNWNGIISCSGPAHSERVALLLLEELVGERAVAEVSRYRNGLQR